MFERYVALAREAQTSGDRVAAENLYQHAEHYFRVMNAQGEGQGQGRRGRRPRPISKWAAATAMREDERGGPGASRWRQPPLAPAPGDDQPPLLLTA